jgi:non-specific serine/threonine protein kinase
VAVATESRSSAHDWAVYGAGVLAVQQGDLAASEPLLERAAALAAESGDENLAAHVARGRGSIAAGRGEFATARSRYEAALASYERIGFSDPIALVTYSRLAAVCMLAYELDEAVRLCEECVRRCDELGEQWARGTALWVRGAARWLSADIPGAIEDALACLRVKVALGDLYAIAMSFDLLSVCLVSTGDFERAAVLHGAGDALWMLLKAPVLMGPAYGKFRTSAADTSRDRLGEERFEALMRRGATMPLSAALAVATGEAPASGAAAGGSGVGRGVGVGVDPANESDDPRAKPLTRRERQIAEFVAAGLGNREIAMRLVLSKRTVDSHIDHIFTKLGFSSRTQLVGWVLEQKKDTSS